MNGVRDAVGYLSPSTQRELISAPVVLLELFYTLHHPALISLPEDLSRSIIACKQFIGATIVGKLLVTKTICVW